MQEFHIAHEEMVQGRKKFIIPIMHQELKANQVEDPTLKMYMETYTYLECKDLVSICMFKMSW